MVEFSTVKVLVDVAISMCYGLGCADIIVQSTANARVICRVEARKVGHVHCSRSHIGTVVVISILRRVAIRDECRQGLRSLF